MVAKKRKELRALGFLKKKIMKTMLNYLEQDHFDNKIIDNIIKI